MQYKVQPAESETNLRQKNHSSTEIVGKKVPTWVQNGTLLAK
jgi:hypothetical protein